VSKIRPELRRSILKRSFPEAADRNTFGGRFAICCDEWR
jgi:hypothetical protein